MGPAHLSAALPLRDAFCRPPGSARGAFSGGVGVREGSRPNAPVGVSGGFLPVVAVREGCTRGKSPYGRIASAESSWRGPHPPVSFPRPGSTWVGFVRSV